MATDQSTGGGGDEITLTFLGQGRYAGQADTLRCYTTDSDTDDLERRKVANLLKMGLVRYVARTPLTEHVTIGFSLPSEETKAEDRWNSWVFEVEANCWLNGQKAYRA
ncbi:MAG: hypothetical protein ABIE70_05220 [bacterium]